MISIRLNGERLDVPDSTGLEKMLETLSLPTKRIAVELNGRVIRRADWPTINISDGDKIEVVHFVGGG